MTYLGWGVWTPDTELAHHGIMGMKWGDRNGPPYPLRPGARSGAEKKAGTPIADKFADASRKLKKKAAVSKAKRTRRKKAKYEHDRQEALRKGSADDILKYRGNLSNEEMETAYKRIQWENKLESLSKESRKNGMTKADKLLGNEGTIGKIKEYSGNIAGVMQNINKINKALKGDSGDEKEDKKDKKDKNKDKEKNIVINNYVNGEKVNDSSGSKPKNEQQSGKKTESSQESKPTSESKSEPDTSDVQETIDKGRSYVERNYTSLNNTESYQNYYKDKEAKESSRNEYGGIDIKRYDRYMRHSMIYLAHHGVKDMHWGIRRYQPYPAGKSGKFVGRKKLHNPRNLKKARLQVERRFEDELRKPGGWYDTSAEIDKRVSKLVNSNKKLKDIQKNWSGDGSEFVWEIQARTGDKKLKELDNKAYEQYALANNKRQEELRNINAQYNSETANDPTFRKLHAKTEAAQEALNKLANSYAGRTIYADEWKEYQQKAKPLHEKVNNAFAEERKRLSSLDPDYKRLSDEFDEAIQYAKEVYAKTDNWEERNAADKYAEYAEYDLENYYSQNIKPYKR